MKRLFFDLEVSPNLVWSWRIGYNINLSPENLVHERAIICAAWKWAGESEVHAATWDEQQNDERIIAPLVAAIHEADEVVAYFGESFDMRWLRTQALRHGILIDPWVKVVDPLKWVRGKFMFNSNKLDFIAKTLGIGAKLDAPFDLWRRIVLYNDPEAMDKMVSYNKHDVEILEKVHDKFSPWVKPATHVGVLDGMEKWTCPYCGSTHVRVETTKVTAAGSIRKFMDCKECRRYYQIGEAAHKQYLAWKKSLNQ